MNTVTRKGRGATVGYIVLVAAALILGVGFTVGPLAAFTTLGVCVFVLALAAAIRFG